MASRPLKMAALAAAFACVLHLGLGGCSKVGSIVQTGGDKPTGKEPNLLLLYLDESGSVDGKGKDGKTHREHLFEYGVEFLRKVKPSEPTNVNVSVSTFGRFVNPQSDLTLRSKPALLKAIQRYKDAAPSSDDDAISGEKAIRGTSLKAVLENAGEKVRTSGASNVAILIITDGGTEDFKGGDLKGLEQVARKISGLPGLHLAVVGLTGSGQGEWRRFHQRIWSSAGDKVRIGKNEEDSFATIAWLAEAFTAAEAPAK